jgi:hypothetical protein
VWLSLPDVFVTLQPVPLAVVLLVLALLYLLMAGAMRVYVQAVLVALSALVLVQRAMLAEMEMLAVLALCVVLSMAPVMSPV